MKRIFMRKIKNERGQSLVEMAVSLVFLLLLLSGAVEFGIAFFQFIELRDAAQEGALFGSINPNVLAPIETRARGASNRPINLSDNTTVGVVVTARDKTTNAPISLASACEGDGLTVTLTYSHKIFMPFIPRVLGRTFIPLTASVTDTILSPLC
ncbi:MAG: TadE/TadG family type IV pilus assembly protein [Chloroflexota bacterium]